MKTTLFLTAVLGAIFLTGCGGSSHKYDVDVQLGGNVAQPGEVYSLTDAFAEALACAPADLTWTITEGIGVDLGGLITQTGDYTAPSCGSPFVGATVHVVAAGCGRTGTAAISITEELSSVVISHAVVNPGTPQACSAPNPESVPVLPGQQVQFYADLQFTCRLVTSPTPPATWPPVCP